MERISALMDGELEAGDILVEFGRIKSDEGLLQKWETYHLIGDVLRKEGIVAAGFHGFGDRFRETLAKEPTILAPRLVTVPPKARLYALSAAASVAGVAAVAWLAFMNQPTSQGTGGDSVVVAPKPDASVKEYLFAHHVVAPIAAVPSLAQYVHNVNLRDP